MNDRGQQFENLRSRNVACLYRNYACVEIKCSWKSRFFFKLLWISQVLLISKARKYFLYSIIKNSVQNKNNQNFQWYAIVAGVARINISKIGPRLKERFRSILHYYYFFYFFFERKLWLKKRVWFHGFSGLLPSGGFWREGDRRRVGESESYSRVIVIAVVTLTDYYNFPAARKP